jgi:hypothetical protein
MNISPNQNEVLNKNKLPYLVRSTLKSAFVDPFNWFMVGAIGLFAIPAGYLFVTTFSWILLILFGASAWFLFHYISAVSNREIEISLAGVRYREASRKLFFAWDEIEAIKVEPYLGQITFWQNGKLSRIHEFGLPKKEREIMRHILIAMANSKQIKLQVIGE